jgi:hypothetical protein
MAKSGSLHSYHLVLADGSERDVKGHDINAHDGALIVLNNERGAVVMYAAGQWRMAELERKDDK